jgi:hypothetical protein
VTGMRCRSIKCQLARIAQTGGWRPNPGGGYILVTASQTARHDRISIKSGADDSRDDYLTKF